MESKASLIPQISDAEWEVMNVLWQEQPLTSFEVVARLSTQFDWHARTIKTMLNRLVRKGALSYEVEGNRYLYRPRVRREACIREESRSFLNRVFGGSSTSMLMHFVENTELSPEEIQELRELLEAKEK